MGAARFSLLRILADGQVHSRDEIGRKLSLSAKELSRLEGDLQRLGVRLLDAGDGCRLEDRIDLYDVALLVERVERQCPGLRLEVLDECPSTNTVLAARARSGAADCTALVCEHQAAGRGRRGNAWVSAIGGSVTFSVLKRFHGGAGALAGLSLAAAVGAAEGLERLGVRQVALKWPNDLLYGERKLGGILVETAGEASGSIAAVVGVGVNVRLNATVRGQIDRPVTDLASSGAAAHSRTAVLAGLLGSIVPALERFSREGFSPFRQAWLRRHAWRDRQVVLLGADRSLAEGRVVGIAEDGALELASERGVERFHSGELSLRLR